MFGTRYRCALWVADSRGKLCREKQVSRGYNVAFFFQVSNGKGAMPAWEDRLSEDEIQSVAEYVFTTADAGKW